MFEILEPQPMGTVIKVVGVGGAGGNAVDHMIRNGVKGVDFIAATDAGLDFLHRVIAHEAFRRGEVFTGFIEAYKAELLG